MVRTSRQARYGVAMSLDGCIAGPDGEADWIVHDPDIDFGEIFRSLLDAGLVDGVDVAIAPVLLGRGIPPQPPIH